MDRLADLRESIRSMDQAEDVFRNLAICKIRVEKDKAQTEASIARVKERHIERISGDCAIMSCYQALLTQYIAANKNLFEKPRTHKTQFGEFGRRLVTELDITDLDTLLTWLMEQGYDDCFEVTRTPIKRAIKDRLNNEEDIPGCQLKSGDTAVCKVAKALLDEARDLDR